MRDRLHNLTAFNINADARLTELEAFHSQLLANDTSLQQQLDTQGTGDATCDDMPVVRGGVISATYMDAARGVAVSPNGNYVFVTGYNSDSVAVVDVC